MATTKLKIQGITCLKCVTHVDKSLRAVPRVKDVTVRQDEGATVEHDGASERDLIQAVESKGGYKAEVLL
jgi:copper chaperone CopZ